VANDVTCSDAGFCAETNQVKIIDRKGHIEDVALCSKLEVAHRVLDSISQWMRDRVHQV
jgi:phosphopantothenoylcysteine synthetase/decarboxylase